MVLVILPVEWLDQEGNDARPLLGYVRVPTDKSTSTKQRKPL